MLPPHDQSIMLEKLRESGGNSAGQARVSAAGAHIPAPSTRDLGPEPHPALFAAYTRQDDRVSIQTDVRRQEIADFSQTTPVL